MPIYEYECNNKHRFEVIQSFDEAPVTQCTVCGSPVQKLPSSPAIQFKGTGWYVTDYARKGENSASSGSSSTSSSEKSASTETSSHDKGGSSSAKEPKESPSK